MSCKNFVQAMAYLSVRELTSAWAFKRQLNSLDFRILVCVISIRDGDVSCHCLIPVAVDIVLQ